MTIRKLKETPLSCLLQNNNLSTRISCVSFGSQIGAVVGTELNYDQRIHLDKTRKYCSKKQASLFLGRHKHSRLFPYVYTVVMIASFFQWGGDGGLRSHAGKTPGTCSNTWNELRWPIKMDVLISGILGKKCTYEQTQNGNKMEKEIGKIWTNPKMRIYGLSSGKIWTTF